MKNYVLLYLTFVGLANAFAQANGAAALPPIAVQTDLDWYWDLAIALISPVVVWAVARTVPMLPKVLLPSMTPLVGIGVGLTLNKLSGAHLSWYDMGKAGALAVFVREVVNQAITKQLAANTGQVKADVPSAPVTPPPAVP